MKVILLRDVSKIGKKYDVKEVPSGYARNFLIRRGDALFATEEATHRIQKIREIEEKEKARGDASITDALEALNGKKITLKARASEKGSLFAGITKGEIQKLIQEKLGISLPEELIKLPSPIKETGGHKLELGTEDAKKKAALTLTIERASEK